MQMLALSPELCGKIVELTTQRRHDLLSLCLTCKAFQREAEVRIYTSMILPEPTRALAACETLMSNERLAQYVRTFWYTQELQQRRDEIATLGREFWTAIQLALIAVSNLENLLISDNSYENSWILDTPAIRFRLRELKVRFAWDGPFVRFLETQSSLRSLHFYDSAEEITHYIQPQCLPELRIFDGTLTIGAQLVPSNVTHLQLVVDSDPPSLEVFSRFGLLRKTLRGFSLLDLPDNISLRTLDIISRVLPDLRHLGMFPYPMTNRHEFHQCLMRMHYLQVLELDLGRWSPQPAVTAGQRMLAAEIQTFCPNIKMVVLWIGNTRCRWVHGNQWQSQISSRQFPQSSNAWCLA